MANVIKPKRSNTASNVPTTANTSSGELAVNMADQKIYINNGTSIVQVGAGTLPALSGVAISSPTANQVLQYNGTNWVNATASGSGTVTSITAGTGLSGGTITTTGTIALANTAVTAGSYTTANITVDAQGRITAASSGTSGVSSVTGTAPIASSGGSTPAISISQATTSTNGYLSSTDWNTFNNKTSNIGTVTSVAATAGTGISISGSPITTSGTLTITNTAPDQVVAFTNGTGISVTGTYPNFTVTNTAPSSGGTVTSVTGTAPVVSSGGNTPAISMAAATASVNGYMTSTYASKLDGIAAGATNVTNTNQLTNGAGYITGITSGMVTTALGYTPYNSTNPSGYITSSGSITGSSASCTGNAATASDSSLLNGISAVNLFDNMGQSHSTATSFDAQGATLSRDFGYRYVQGNTNAPNVGNTGNGQYYSWNIGLGSEYAYNSYACQFAIPRASTTPYLSVRFEEGGALGAWQKLSAGYADTAGSAPANGGTSAACSGNSATASNPASGGSFITSSNIGSQSVNYAGTAGAAYPYRVGGVVMQMNWSGQGGQPTWLWGGNDGTNFYVYNPSNFSVNYANTAGSAPASGGTSAACSGNAATATTSTNTFSGKVWNNVTSSRAINTTYTNSNAFGIWVIASAFWANGSAFSGYYVINGNNVIYWGGGNYNGGQPQSFWVPAGQTYRYTVGGGSITSWWELY